MREATERILSALDLSIGSDVVLFDSVAKAQLIRPPSDCLCDALAVESLLKKF